MKHFNATITLLATAINIVLFSAALSHAQPSGISTQDPLAGSRVFGSKGCSQCHAVNGVGGKIAADLGRIAPGYSADIIAVEGNPLEDATVLEKVDWVMVRGRVIE